MLVVNKKPAHVKTFQRGLNLIQQGHFDDAEKAFKSILLVEPKALDVRINLGFIAFKKGNYTQAYDMFSKITQEVPNDIESLNRLALSAMYLGKFDEAEKLLLQCVEARPEHYDTWMNLCALAGFMHDEIKGLNYATKALSIRPNDANSYVNFGSTLQACNRPKDAAHAFETALLLDKKQIGALVNLGVINAQLGDDAKAIEYYDKAIDSASPKDATRVEEATYYKSMCYLRQGRLKEAWSDYDHGFAKSLTHGRGPRRSFKVPQWRGEALPSDARLMCWKEQGIGDELMFLSCLPQLQNQANNLIVECDERLVSALARSFPNIHFREAIYYDDTDHSSVYDDFDFHIPLGSAFGLMRQDIESFSHATPIIQPMTELRERLSKRIGNNDGRLKVGICWRSGNLSTMRNVHYTSLSDWLPIFSARDDVDFFNLQYGDFIDEVKNANQHYNLHINCWPDIDYKNDLEALFALSSSLDLVITVGTAVSTIASAVGTPTWLMSMPSWTTFGTDRFLSFPDVRLFRSPLNGAVKDQIEIVANELKALPKKV